MFQPLLSGFASELGSAGGSRHGSRLPTPLRREPTPLRPREETRRHILPSGNEESLIELSGRAARAWGGSLKCEAESLNSEVFDLTERHTARLFEALTLNGKMSIPLFSRALEIEGFRIPENDGNNEDLLERIFEQLRGQTDPFLGKHTFQTGLQLLKLQVLYSLESNLFRSGRLQRIDWSPVELRDAYFKPLAVKDVREHLISERDQTRFPMRWVNLESPEPNDILRVAVEYNLHPLAIEEVLKNIRQSVPRMRKYGEHCFILLPIMRLTEASKMMLSEHRRQVDVLGRRTTCMRVAVELECAQLCIFTRIAPLRDTVLSIVSAWKPFSLMHHTQTRESRGTHSEDQKNLLKLAKSAPGGNSIPRLFDKVAKSLQKDFSESRLANASQLPWLLSSSVLEQYKDVSDAYAARLSWCEDNRQSVRMDVDLMRLQADLTSLLRELRPITPLVERGHKQLDIAEDERVYVNEVCDDLSRIVEDVSRSIDLCKALREEIRSEIDAKTNNLIFKLSLLASVLMPWQFLTGLYGMNFVDAGGKPAVPFLGEMALERSYIMFWGIGVSMTCMLLVWWFCSSR